MFRLKHLVVDSDDGRLYIRELENGDSIFIMDIEYIVLNNEH